MGQFIIKKTPSGGFNFSLIAENKEKIATSTQVYSAKSTCKNGIESIGRNAPLCIEQNKIEDNTLKKPVAVTCPKFEIYFDKAGLYRYRLFASNGENIAICEEGYKTKQGCINGMRSVAVNSVNSEIIDETKDK